MENSPVVPGSPYFIMTYDTAKKLTGITEQTGILAVKNSDGNLDEVLTAVQEIADENGKIEVNMIEQTIKNIQHQYRASINALYMASAILFVFGSISLISIAACQRLDAVNHCISLKLPWLFLIALVAVMGGIYLIFVAYAKVELKKAEILPAIREE